MKWLLGFVALALLLDACGGGGGSTSVPGPPPGPSPSPTPTIFFQPLAVGDTWTYACYMGTPSPGASTFPKTNKVLGTAMVHGTQTFEYAQQIPSSPTQSTTVIQLLANDATGNTLIYGYLPNVGGSPQPLASPVVIVAQSPGPPLSIDDYPAEHGGTVQRIYCCHGNTNPTVFGVYVVNEYFEGSHILNNTTDGYGYALGQGVMEEDHILTAPQRIDCLITATPPP
ncbi:MAG TPA: hypothetical protein VJN22_05740 [Candidatus Eremiobacteraceae bacterium]|nr:hypothetical protein [Candidatus Eremiobacteraceae bacterium]